MKAFYAFPRLETIIAWEFILEEIPCLPLTVTTLSLRLQTLQIPQIDSMVGLDAALGRLEFLSVSLVARSLDTDSDYLSRVLFPYVMAKCHSLRSLNVYSASGRIDLSCIRSMKNLNSLLVGPVVAINVAGIINEAAPSSLETLIISNQVTFDAKFCAAARKFKNIRKLLLLDTDMNPSLIINSLSSDKSLFPALQEVLMGYLWEAPTVVTSVPNRPKCAVVPVNVIGHFVPKFCDFCGRCQNFEFFLSQCCCN